MSTPNRKSRPSRTPEARTNQLIRKAYDLAEKQLEDGSATSQVITHFLSLATAKTELELEQLRKRNRLLEAQTESIDSAKRAEEMFSKAISAFRNYSGQKETGEGEND